MTSTLIQKLGMIAGLAAASLGIGGCATLPNYSAPLNSTPSATSPADNKAVKAEENCGCGTAGKDNKHLCSTRFRSETTGTSQKFTFGLADCKDGKHGDEYFRLYQYANGDDTTALAYTLPTFKFADIESKNTLFGSFGDRGGIGLESANKFGKYTLTFNLEDSITKDSTRIGAGLDYKINDKLTIGGAFDTINTPNGRTNQGLAKIIYDLSPTDQLGAALVVADKEGNQTNSVLGYWGHYGKDESWGTRTWVKYDNSEKLSFDSIIAKNSTFGKGSYPWMVGRNRGDMFGMPVTESALDPERVPLQERTKSGWFGDVQGCFDFRNDTKTLGVAGGYRFAGEDWEISPLLSYTYNSAKTDCVGAGILIRPRKILGGNLCFELSGTHPLDGGKDSVYLGLMYSCPIGAPGKH